VTCRDDVEIQESCRPAEVAIFARCASQDPRFKEVVLGPRGLCSLFSALDVALPEAGIHDDVEWDSLEDIVFSLYWVTKQSWVAKTVDPQSLRFLLNNFRLITPKRCFKARCVAVLSIHNIISQQREMLHVLVDEDAKFDFQNLILSPIPQGADNMTLFWAKSATEGTKWLLAKMEALANHPKSRSDV